MVKRGAHIPERLFQHTKINKHPACIEFRSAGMRENPVVMAMEPFAFSVVIGKKMRGSEFRFHSYFKHISHHTL